MVEPHAYAAADYSNSNSNSSADKPHPINNNDPANHKFYIAVSLSRSIKHPHGVELAVRRNIPYWNINPALNIWNHILGNGSSIWNTLGGQLDCEIHPVTFTYSTSQHSNHSRIRVAGSHNHSGGNSLDRCGSEEEAYKKNIA